MTKLSWDVSSLKMYELGVDHAVLYTKDELGVPWSGIVSVENPASGGSIQSYYIDGERFATLQETQDFEINVSAWSSPEEFDYHDGTLDLGGGVYLTEQKRMPFSFSYRTNIGSALGGQSVGYKIHIVYNLLAEPTAKNYTTINEDPELTPLSWKFVSNPVTVTGNITGSHLCIVTTNADPMKIMELEDILYGNDDTAPRLPSPDEVIDLFNEGEALFIVIDNLDGSFSITAPDEALVMLDANTFELTWPTAFMLDRTRYKVSSI